MNTTCEVLQRERMAYISKCAYREIRKMIPDSLDKPLMGPLPLRQTQRSPEGPRHLHRIPRLSEAPWEVP